VRNNVTLRPDVNASIVATQPAQTFVLQAGATHDFTFLLERPSYRRLAPTYLDASAGFPAVPAAESVYAIAIDAFCSGSDGSSFVRHHSKMLCEPLIGTSTRSRIACAAHRGTYARETTDSTVLAHLTTANCRAAGITSSTVNDGHCNAANNVPGCYDGGDCCSYSCWARNGQFIQLSSSGSDWEFQHTCYNLNDTRTCIDPAVQGYVPPADFTVAPSPGSFSGVTTDNLGTNNCTEIAASLAPRVSSCSTLRELLCHDPALAGRDCGAAFAQALAGRLGCSAPRCPTTQHGCRCQSSWSASFSGATFTGTGCSNPDADPNGNWCVIIDGSCTGRATSFGLPNGDWTVGTSGQHYDYCGTGAGSQQGPMGGFDAQYAAAARTVPDPIDTTGWEPLAVVATRTATSHAAHTANSHVAKQTSERKPPHQNVLAAAHLHAHT